MYTIGENIIGAPKMRNHFLCPIKLLLFQYCDNNIRLFYIAPCKVIAPHLSFFRSLLFNLIAFFIVIALLRDNSKAFSQLFPF